MVHVTLDSTNSYIEQHLNDNYDCFYYRFLSCSNWTAKCKNILYCVT